jgi:hypothetical protein
LLHYYGMLSLENCRASFIAAAAHAEFTEDGVWHAGRARCASIMKRGTHHLQTDQDSHNHKIWQAWFASTGAGGATNRAPEARRMRLISGLSAVS